MTTVDCNGIDLGSNEDDTRVWTADVSWITDGDQLVDAEDLAAHVAAIGQMMLGIPVEQLAERIAAQLANQPVFRSVTVTVHMHWKAPLRTFEQLSATVAANRQSSANPSAAAANTGGEESASTHDGALPVDPAYHDAVISLRSAAPNAEQLFREVIVTLDSMPGNQVDGISPLYFVGSLNGTDGHAAVIKLSTAMGTRQLNQVLDALHTAHEGALQLSVVAIGKAGMNHCMHRRARRIIISALPCLSRGLPWIPMPAITETHWRICWQWRPTAHRWASNPNSGLWEAVDESTQNSMVVVCDCHARRSACRHGHLAS